MKKNYFIIIIIILWNKILWNAFQRVRTRFNAIFSILKRGQDERLNSENIDFKSYQTFCLY